MSSYRAFFVTVASRGGVPQPIAEGIVERLDKWCDEIDYVSESHESGKIHIHMMLLTKRSYLRQNWKRTVTRVVTDYIPAPDVKSGLNIRVITSYSDVEQYMKKASDLRCAFPKLQEYVRENFTVAESIIKENVLYKANQLKYAYDNWDTWKTELDWSQPIQDIWADYTILIAEHHGKTPATHWKKVDQFQRLCILAGRIQKPALRDTCPKILIAQDVMYNSDVFKQEFV